MKTFAVATLTFIRSSLYESSKLLVGSLLIYGSLFAGGFGAWKLSKGFRNWSIRKLERASVKLASGMDNAA